MRVPARKLASPFGHSTQVSTQVELASTCDYFQFRLAKALKKLWTSQLEECLAYTQSFPGKILNFYSLSKEFVYLSFQDELIIRHYSFRMPLSFYFLLIAKLYLWYYRRFQILPSLAGFKIKIKIKFETKKYICTKNKILDQFNQKWGTIFPVKTITIFLTNYCISFFETFYCLWGCTLT